jgi:hypothetical protein
MEVIYMTAINQIKLSTSREEARSILESRTPEMRLIILRNAIESLDREIESDIASENIDIAIFKMSQVVMLEDEKHIVERVILKAVVA